MEGAGLWYTVTFWLRYIWWLFSQSHKPPAAIKSFNLRADVPASALFDEAMSYLESRGILGATQRCSFGREAFGAAIDLSM